MTIQETYDHITKYMSAEQALMKLLEGHVRTYDHLKFNEGEELHPLMVVTMAALDMGWSIAIPDGSDDEEVTGMAIGTEDYLNNLFKSDCKSNCGGSCSCNHDHPDKEEN